MGNYQSIRKTQTGVQIKVVEKKDIEFKIINISNHLVDNLIKGVATQNTLAKTQISMLLKRNEILF